MTVIRVVLNAWVVNHGQTRMRKNLINEFDGRGELSAAGSWLYIESIGIAELSSEDPRHPFEQALHADPAVGWKASVPGPQVIRIRFDHTQLVRRVLLRFQEEQVERSQEIALFGTTKHFSRRELMRQQWVFSPRGATSEVEDYFFDLRDLEVLELQIDPGRHDRQVFASLRSIQLG